MNALTTDQITDVDYRVVPSLVLHPATVAYLQLLISPYAEAIKDATPEDLRVWIPQAYKGELGTIALERMNAVFEKKGEVSDDVAGRDFAIRYLIEELVERVGKNLTNFDTAVIWPWHIQSVIYADPNLSAMFGFPQTPVPELPVEVTVDAQEFSVDLTMEFVAGLLLFSDKRVGNIDFNVRVFGVPFQSSDVVNDLPSRFEERGDNMAPYYLTVNTEAYDFDTPDFMRGFATGAQWAGVDHHAYWTALRRVTTENGIIVETAITF